MREDEKCLFASSQAESWETPETDNKKDRRFCSDLHFENEVCRFPHETFTSSKIEKYFPKGIDETGQFESLMPKLGIGPII